MRKGEIDDLQDSVEYKEPEKIPNYPHISKKRVAIKRKIDERNNACEDARIMRDLYGY